ncbi:malonic semialdehyde reductase [Aeromicrobium sp. Root472D3]|uniref:malonic semialdehyde reductase n=1 Tax=Aeromicrobium sp. Root472D3 TaxID=1736540 RepID=UPI0006F38001|nr:malonic semialdehyde reductase [Aeromicrobium sp. Root472D3]KQX73785.1 malonic semialdehyde reductase [Aeromicrobium sp. Root472D3]
MTSSTETSPFVLGDDTLDVLFREARSVNAFSDEPVSAEQVREVFELVKLGPTMMNIQPMRLLLVEQGEGRDRLVPHMAEGNRTKAQTAPLVAVVAADTDFHTSMDVHFPHKPGIGDMFAGDDANRYEVARYNTALQTGYFIIGIRAAGLHAGPVGGFDAAGIDGEFFGGTTWRTQLVINIGHPGENPWFDRLPRISADDAVRTV